MGAQLRRRTVYAATIVAMLAMVGGFGLAAFTIASSSATYGNIGPGTTTANYGATAWSAPNPTLTNTVPAGYTGTCDSGPVAVVHGTTSNLVVAGIAGNSCTTGDQAVEFIFTTTSEVCPTTGSDNFAITSVTGAGTIGPTTVAVTCTAGATTSLALDVWIDDGTGAVTLTSDTVQVTQTAAGEGY